jgi:hypothetical protein
MLISEGQSALVPDTSDESSMVNSIASTSAFRTRALLGNLYSPCPRQNHSRDAFIQLGSRKKSGPSSRPITALDVVVQKSVLTMIREVQQEMGISILFVAHDMAVHANLTDRLGIMYVGRLVKEGRTRDIARRRADAWRTVAGNTRPASWNVIRLKTAV